MERTPSRSPSPRRSPSPHRVRSPPPHGRRSPSPHRRKRSPSPRRGRSPSPRVGRSPSPRRARSPSPPRRGRSPSPRGRVRSPSPRRARSPPRGRSPPPHNRSPSPRGRGRSPSPLRGRRSPPRDRSPPRHYASRSSHSDRAIFVGNMDPLCPIPEIERLFAPYGKVLRVDMKHGYAFIFLDRGHEEAIRGLDGFLYMGRRLKLEFAKGDGAIKRREEMRKEEALRRPCETLFVVNYDPIRTTQEDLSRLFSPYGHITRIEMRRNFSFVQFERVEQATEALKTLNQTKLMDRIINIEYVARAPPPPESLLYLHFVYSLRRFIFFIVHRKGLSFFVIPFSFFLPLMSLLRVLFARFIYFVRMMRPPTPTPYSLLLLCSTSASTIVSTFSTIATLLLSLSTLFAVFFYLLLQMEFSVLFRFVVVCLLLFVFVLCCFLTSSLRFRFRFRLFQMCYSFVFVYLFDLLCALPTSNPLLLTCRKRARSPPRSPPRHRSPSPPISRRRLRSRRYRFFLFPFYPLFFLLPYFLNDFNN
ncbi:putative Arginine/serine-rich splicing factor [Balamuthia mandrillaris]